MDRFRKNYTPTTLEQKAAVLTIKEKAEELEALITAAHREPTGWNEADAKAFTEMDEEGKEKNRAERTAARETNRCLRLSLTRLEESVMWAVKGVMTEAPPVADGSCEGVVS